MGIQVWAYGERKERDPLQKERNIFFKVQTTATSGILAKSPALFFSGLNMKKKMINILTLLSNHLKSSPWHNFCHMSFAHLQSLAHSSRNVVISKKSWAQWTCIKNETKAFCLEDQK